ncbi:hypothetical protein jhhlp_000959 [Lomentospora prolificans]|uniref:Uncharacterized protein n=1 Tax=Lomentospora prolificans TaxID=41688 RepID=A0A2N3NJX4_9PEZI|nr:hypothetical protein jhhlp_000959 [Lomentospora prolificans]
MVPYALSMSTDVPQPFDSRKLNKIKGTVGLYSILAVLGSMIAFSKKVANDCAAVMLDNSAIDAAFTESMSILATEANILQYPFPPQNASLAHLFSSQVAFCFAVGALLHGVHTNLDELASCAVNCLDPRSRFTQPENHTWQAYQSMGLAAVGTLTWLIGRGDKEARPQLPSPRRIPFRRTSKSELPLALPREMTGEIPRPTLKAVDAAFSLAPSWRSWNEACVAQFVQDITEGSWRGVTINCNTITYMMGLQLEDVRFIITPDAAADNLTLEGNGFTDTEGPVKLAGTINKKTGGFELSRQPRGASGSVHRLRGTMTPLGLVGYWGESEQAFNGLAWMYKQDWVASQNE